MIRSLFIALACACFSLNALAEMPKITGKPVIDTPKLLDWPTDQGIVTPNLNDPTSNTLNDLHANIGSCDLVLSTEGNYHPALHDVWPVFLTKFKDQPLQNWFYTTSPPIVIPQIKNGIAQFGNFYSTCKPSVAVASKKVIDKLVAAGEVDGQPYPLYKDRGEVILVKAGNPKHIKTIWDLARKNVTIATPNPELEPGAFNNCAEAIYNIAANDPHPPKGMTPEKLINMLFNGASHNKNKWMGGALIHHRDVPWSIAYGKADAGVIHYHLGLYMSQTFPDQLAIIPLGGTVADPQPLPGTKVGTRYMAKLKGNWTPRQQEARDMLVDTLLSNDFTQALIKRGLARPDGFNPAVASAK